MDPKSILTCVEGRRTWMHNSLRVLVEQESPSEDASAVNAAASLVERLAVPLGFRSKRHRQKEFGDVLELQFGATRSKQKPVLLLGHLDTVWSPGTLARMPWREAKGRFHGPGVLDMKAGVVMALAAVSTLGELNLARPLTLLLNSDEEMGSPVSRPIT